MNLRGAYLPGSRERDGLLRLPLADLVMWHVTAKCSHCPRERMVPLRGWADRFGYESTLLRLVPKLRCGACHGLPSRVMLRNRTPDQTGPRLVVVRLF